jgi:hypothetical protein
LNVRSGKPKNINCDNFFWKKGKIPHCIRIFLC